MTAAYTWLSTTVPDRDLSTAVTLSLRKRDFTFEHFTYFGYEGQEHIGVIPIKWIGVPGQRANSCTLYRLLPEDRRDKPPEAREEPEGMESSSSGTASEEDPQGKFSQGA